MKLQKLISSEYWKGISRNSAKEFEDDVYQRRFCAKRICEQNV